LRFAGAQLIDRLQNCRVRAYIARVKWHNSSRVTAAPGFIAPCLPTNTARAPAGPLWLHEIKHEGYRLSVRKHENRVRIFTRRGADWTHRFPLIVEAARRLKATSLYLDGEGVVCGKDGVSVFDKLRSKAHDDSVFLYAFDLLELDGVDLRSLALEARKARLAKLLRSRRSGIVVNEHIEGDGALISSTPASLALKASSRTAAICVISQAE
jgi:bifunctional non-homologous end joining protein LigD